MAPEVAAVERTGGYDQQVIAFVTKWRIFIESSLVLWTHSYQVLSFFFYRLNIIFAFHGVAEWVLRLEILEKLKNEPSSEFGCKSWKTIGFFSCFAWKSWNYAFGA